MIRQKHKKKEEEQSQKNLKSLIEKGKTTNMETMNKKVLYAAKQSSGPSENTNKDGKRIKW